MNCLINLIIILFLYNKYFNIQNNDNQIQLSTFMNKKEDIDKNEIEEEIPPLFFQKKTFIY